MSEPGDIVGGRYELTELMAVWKDDRGWVCPRCDKETNSYGHHRCEARGWSDGTWSGPSMPWWAEGSNYSPNE